jgi:glycosyltransferase involved in cell wall biosynthesis
VIDHVARRGGIVRPFELTGHYLNVNTVEDLNAANYLARTLRFPDAKVSVVIPGLQRGGAIAHVVRDFRPHAHEIVVMDNQSSDGTADLARAEGRRRPLAPLRGLRRCAPAGSRRRHRRHPRAGRADATFRAKDIGKLLEFLKDADMVIGTRTTRQMVEQGANMDGLLRWGNVVVGKLVEALWWANEPRFTDVGCTYRALWRDAWSKIRDYITRPTPRSRPR